MKKLRGKRIRNQILRKLLYPKHIYHIIRLSRQERQKGRSADDAQLKFYARILKDGYLHYGFFDNPERDPETISLRDFYRAQQDYAEKLTESLSAEDSPVLDVGCGLGGLMHLLDQRGYEVTGLTPDRFQVAFIREKYPDYKLIHSKFERMDPEAYKNHFGTVINSESLQYIKLDKAIPLVKTILKPGGKWLISDYFRLREAHEKSGHKWEDFKEILALHHFKITGELDITNNIKPTLAFLHMWGTRFGLSLYEFLTGKLARKKPGLEYILDEVLSDTHEYIDDHLKLIDPEQFMNDKKYVILVVERAS